ncbi:MAG TPA: hypothetical protein DCF63_02405 [Planctomycetaceae bacterium]|nr:hypothetical protein [Planctomycetaceae bacterium]
MLEHSDHKTDSAFQISQACRHLLAQLNHSFHAGFGLLRRGSDNWKIIPVDVHGNISGSSSQLEPETANWLDQIDWSDLELPQIRPLGDQQAFVAACCLDDNGNLEMVGGRIVLNALELAASTAKLTVKQVQVSDQQLLIDQYAEKLSASYEELTYLRRLSKHVEYCVANRTLSEVAQTILPKLQDLLEVQALCLVEVQVDETSGLQSLGRISGCTGGLPSDLDYWCPLLDGLDSRNPQVKVRNFESPLHIADLPKRLGIRSIAIAPIHKNGSLYGWLLAANKRNDVRVTNDPRRPLMNSLGHDELGSMEASLLEATALMLGSQASNNQLYHELEQFIVEVIHTLVGVVEAKDAYTCGHSQRVALVARRLAEIMQLPANQCENIFLAGLLHDVGKIGVSDDVLLKPGQLSDAEFEQIKLHPVIGAELIKKLKPLAKLLPGVMHHHESMDGSGYPHGLKGEEIPMMARVLAVADAWDAMTSDRPYRPGMPIEKALSILKGGSGRQWDSQVLQAFFENVPAMQDVAEYWRTHLSGICSIPSSRPEKIPVQSFDLTPPIISTATANAI